MTFVFTRSRKNQDGTYGPNKKAHFYISISYHAMNAVPSNYKTKWIIQENQEFCVFCLADENNWICQKNQCLYAIINNGETILGQTNERMAKFPIPKNNNPFHGFPVSRENISEELLDKWETSNIITPHLRRKLVQCKI